MGDVSPTSLLLPIVDVLFTLNSFKSLVIYNNVVDAKQLQQQLDCILWRGVWATQTARGWVKAYCLVKEGN